MKYSDLNFYWNRSSRTWFARAIWSHENEPKMSPGMSCSNGGDHIGISTGFAECSDNPPKRDNWKKKIHSFSKIQKLLKTVEN